MTNNESKGINKCFKVSTNPIKFQDIKPGSVFVKVEDEADFNRNLVVKIDEKHGFIMDMDTPGIFDESCEIYLVKMTSLRTELFTRLNEPLEKALRQITIITDKTRSELLEEAANYLVAKYKTKN